MRYLGQFLRYLLNINTVWGFMILIAFGMCVVQHYRPTTTVLPGAQLREGENAIVVRVKGPDDKVVAFPHQVTLTAGVLTIPADGRERGRDRAWLIRTEKVGTGYLLKWDYSGYGQYEVEANGMIVGEGTLVTLQSMTNAAMDYAKSAFNMALGLVATMVLFLGLMKVGEDAGIVQLVARLFHPVIRLLFPGVPKDHPASGAVLMNMTTAVLGLGNASTPFGLKAMKELQSLNPHPEIATDAQVMLIAYNTAGFALIPTMLLATRKAAGCSDPFEIIGTCMVTGAVSTLVALITARLLGRVSFFSVRAALAEEAGLTDSASSLATAGSTTSRKEA